MSLTLDLIMRRPWVEPMKAATASGNKTPLIAV